VINALVLLLGFSLLVLQTTLHHVLVSQWLYPSLVLPLVLYMAVGEFSLARGAALSFVIGYLTDAFSGIPMGYYTFSMVAVFLLARVAGLKLFLHGVVFQVLLTFVASVTAGVLMMGLHVVFVERNRLALGPAMAVVCVQAVATALVSPLVFAVVRRLPGAEQARPQDGAP
jgi:rod shape-determining protein MreD